MDRNFYVHPSSDVSPQASIGEGTKIWQTCQVREGAVIGRNCILSKGVYVDPDVVIGDNVKVQNGVSLYVGVILEDGVFCGPHCVFTNDLEPRAVNPDGSLKSPTDWTVSKTLVRRGASIGANATVVCGTTIGCWAMVGAGAVVTHDVPDYGLVYGNPARLHGFVCPCGQKMAVDEDARSPQAASTSMICPSCGGRVDIPRAVFDSVAK